MADQANSISLPAFLALATLPTSRLDLELFIEALIHLVDQLDGDVDLEPSLGTGDDREADYVDFAEFPHQLGRAADDEPGSRQVARVSP